MGNAGGIFMEKRIWLDKPTELFVEGLPVGNGLTSIVSLGVRIGFCTLT